MHNTTPEKVLLAGSNKSIYGIAVCLSEAGHTVYLKTEKPDIAEKNICRHYEEVLKQNPGNSVRGKIEGPGTTNIRIVGKWEDLEPVSLAFAVTGECLDEKKELVTRLENFLSTGGIMGINTESIPLSEIQHNARNPGSIVGLNWVEPAYNTRFLEIIRNEITDNSLAQRLYEIGIRHWGKDPYLINGELGVRMPLIAALIREAFALVENGYATVEDIDRACRNDAGYYLPFAGNLRYMDLMGTYAYGMVMKDLNPELAKDTAVPEFFSEKIRKGESGMEAGSGFYSYDEEEGGKWEALLRKFSFEVSSLFNDYPFRLSPEEMTTELLKKE